MLSTQTAERDSLAAKDDAWEAQPFYQSKNMYGSSELASEDKVNILLVDDDPRNLLALEAILEGPNSNLVKANSGQECLRRLLEGDFAVILLDVKMPDMDGFETAKLIRERKRSQHTPIIFLTAFETNELQMFRGYSLGAVDYLHKPVVTEVLRAKVAVFVDIFLKTEQVKRQSELLRLIEQREHERQLSEAKERFESERLREEIRIARRIQQNLFPAAPLPLAGYDIGGASFPAEATGGDYFDYIPLRNGTLGIVIGDVSGHGFGPALLMAQTRAYLRAFLMTHTDLAEIVGLLNRALACDTPDDNFVTLLLAQLDPRTRSFRYVSAGHSTGYVLGPSGTLKSSLPSTCMPLAIASDAATDASPEVQLMPGDGVLLLTDGILEACSPDGRLFGVERTLDIMRTHWTGCSRDIINALFNAVRIFCGGKASLDDMTTVLVKVAPERPLSDLPAK